MAPPLKRHRADLARSQRYLVNPDDPFLNPINSLYQACDDLKLPLSHNLVPVFKDYLDAAPLVPMLNKDYEHFMYPNNEDIMDLNFCDEEGKIFYGSYVVFPQPIVEIDQDCYHIATPTKLPTIHALHCDPTRPLLTTYCTVKQVRRGPTVEWYIPRRPLDFVCLFEEAVNSEARNGEAMTDKAVKEFVKKHKLQVSESQCDWLQSNDGQEWLFHVRSFLF